MRVQYARMGTGFRKYFFVNFRHTLNDLLDILENDDRITTADIVIIPPNDLDGLSEADSGDEEETSADTLLGRQLQSEGEIRTPFHNPADSRSYPAVPQLSFDWQSGQMTNSISPFQCKPVSPTGENLSVDESMLPYFGKHGSKQRISSKPIRMGYKMWVMAASTGYVVQFEPYQGARHQSVRSSSTNFGLWRASRD